MDRSMLERADVGKAPRWARIRDDVRCRLRRDRDGRGVVAPRHPLRVVRAAITGPTGAPGPLPAGRLHPAVLRRAAPAVAMMACHFCFNLIDSIWVGRLIGPAALAAVSTAGFYVWVVLSLGEMVEVGLIAVASRRHGEGRPDLAARAAGAAVVYALGAGTARSLLGVVLTREPFLLMTVPREVATFGQRYLDTWLVGGPLVFGFFAIEATFRAAGDTRTPFALLASSVLLSIGLDPLL